MEDGKITCCHWQCRSGIFGDCVVETPFWATSEDDGRPRWMVLKTEEQAAICDCFKEKEKEK